MQQLVYLFVTFVGQNLTVHASRLWAMPFTVPHSGPVTAQVRLHQFVAPWVTASVVPSPRHGDVRLDLTVVATEQLQIDSDRIALVLCTKSVEIENLKPENLSQFFSCLAQSGFTVHHYHNPAAALPTTLQEPIWLEEPPYPRDL